MGDHERGPRHVETHMTLEQFNASGPPDDVRWLFMHWLEGCRTLPGTAHSLRRIEARLERVLTALRAVADKEQHMSQELDALVVQVAETNGTMESAVVAFNGITAKLDKLAADLAAAGIDNAVVVTASADLKSRTDALAAAIVAVPA